MTDYAPLSRRIEDYARKWEAVLDLPGIAINHVFVASTIDDEGTAGITEAKWQYRHAEIKWALPVCVGMTSEELEETIVHELAHVLLGVLDSRLKAGSDEHIELATENVARALLAVRNAYRGSE